MKLSVIIPVYNERNTIRKVLEKVLSVNLSKIGLSREVIIVDGGSTDGVREVLKTVNRPTDTPFKIIYHEKI